MDSNRVASLKNSFRKVRKVFLILFPQVVIYKLKISVFKDFEFNIVVDVSYRYKVNSLAPFLLTFVNLLTYICHTIQYSTQRVEKVLQWSVKAVNRSITVYRGVRGFRKGFKGGVVRIGVQGLRIGGSVKVYIHIYKLLVNRTKT